MPRCTDTVHAALTSYYRYGWVAVQTLTSRPGSGLRPQPSKRETRGDAVIPKLKTYRLAALLMAVGLVAAACGGDDDGGGDGTGTGAGDGDAAADGGSGGEINILSALVEPQDIEGITALADAFTEETGIEVVHEGSPDFETVAVTRVEGGNPPDIILHPQPGLLENFVEQGAAQPLDFVDRDALSEEYVAGTLDTGTFDDTLYGLQLRLSLKSLVWYPLPEYTDSYEFPEDWGGLLEQTEQIAQEQSESGAAPWCIGIESSGATGWVATDWIEDIMLRLHGPEVYDQWVQHEILFDSPEVRAAFEEMEKIWFQEGAVLGGQTNILQTPWNSAPLPLFEDPPGCFLHRQASFVSQSFPEEAEYGTDFDFSLFPVITEENGGTGQIAALTAGDLAAIYTDNDGARQFLEFAAEAENQELWAQSGSYLCPNANCNPDAYPTDAFRKQAELVGEADYSRFDASDLMPGAVGAGAFWTEVVAWISGQQDLDTTLQNIDASWPESAE